MAQVRLQRNEIARRAALVERKRVYSETAKTQKRLFEQIRHLQTDARRERLRHQRELETRVGAAKQEMESREKQLARQMERDAQARIRATREAAEQPHLRIIEKLRGELSALAERRRREVEGLSRDIAKLKERADAHEHMHFGPEGEEQLVAALKEQFPRDGVDHRGKRGDVVHTVFDGGRPLGKIVYECKRTATWQLAFTRQLKKAMETHDTKHGLLVSRKLPRNRFGFCTANRVLVVEPHLAVQVASVLREAIIELGRARLSEEGKTSKTEEIYRYLRSDDFSTAISRIDDKVRDLRGNLEKEKSSHDGWWRAREQNYATILREASGIDGRVQEILSGRPRLVAARGRRLNASVAVRSEA